MDYCLLLSVLACKLTRSRDDLPQASIYLSEWRLFWNRSIQEHSFLTGGSVLRLLVFSWFNSFLSCSGQKRKVWAAFYVLTAVELTANAAIVQSRVGYTDAYKYHDAVLQLKMQNNQFRPDITDFYRINKTAFNVKKRSDFAVALPRFYQYLIRTWEIARDLFTTA